MQQQPQLLVSSCWTGHLKRNNSYTSRLRHPTSRLSSIEGFSQMASNSAGCSSVLSGHQVNRTPSSKHSALCGVTAANQQTTALQQQTVTLVCLQGLL